MNFLRVITSFTRKSELNTVDAVPVTPDIFILFPPNKPWDSSVVTVTIPARVVFATPTIELIVEILSVTKAVPAIESVCMPGFDPAEYFIEFPPGISVILYSPLNSLVLKFPNVPTPTTWIARPTALLILVTVAIATFPSPILIVFPTPYAEPPSTIWTSLMFPLAFVLTCAVASCPFNPACSVSKGTL